MVRIQNKISDNRSGDTARELEPKERRARVEVTLRGQALDAIGLTNLEALGRLECLRKQFFEFWLPTSDSRLGLHLLDVQIFRETGIYGLEAYQSARRERRKRLPRRALTEEKTTTPRKRKLRRKTETGTRLAYAKLNKRCDAALRRLSATWTGAEW